MEWSKLSRFKIGAATPNQQNKRKRTVYAIIDNYRIDENKQENYFRFGYKSFETFSFLFSVLAKFQTNFHKNTSSTQNRVIKFDHFEDFKW